MSGKSLQGRVEGPCDRSRRPSVSSGPSWDQKVDASTTRSHLHQVARPTHEPPKVAKRERERGQDVIDGVLMARKFAESVGGARRRRGLNGNKGWHVGAAISGVACPPDASSTSGNLSAFFRGATRSRNLAVCEGTAPPKTHRKSVEWNEGRIKTPARGATNRSAMGLDS